MKKDFKLLASFWFVTGLVLLLLNDFIFKELYSSWITGKLSDFAGLFIFPLFWTVLFPKHKTKIYLATGIIFICWKLPVSQVFIDSWNSFFFYRISRVVDYSDLLALLILPISFLYKGEKKFFVKTSPAFIIILTAFSFLATSRAPTLDVTKEYSFSFSKDSLKNSIMFIDSVDVIFYGYNNFLRLHSKSIEDKYFIYRNLIYRNHAKEVEYTIQWDTVTFSSFFYVKNPVVRNKILPLLSDTIEIELYDASLGLGENYTALVILKANEPASAIHLTGFGGAGIDSKKELLLKSFEEKVIDRIK